MPTMLFLCTGNYYRSRYAEQFFNHLAEQRNSPWRATSRGLRISALNVGPLSQHAIWGLKQLSLSPDDSRHPQTISAADFQSAARVVAVKEAEHRPLIAKNFPDWVERIEYWQIDDLDGAEAAEALPILAEQVRTLFASLDHDQTAATD